MALDRFLDLFAHRFLCFSSIFEYRRMDVQYASGLGLPADWAGLGWAGSMKIDPRTTLS